MGKLVAEPKPDLHSCIVLPEANTDVVQQPRKVVVNLLGCALAHDRACTRVAAFLIHKYILTALYKSAHHSLQSCQRTTASRQL